MELYEIVLIIFSLTMESFIFCINLGRFNKIKFKDVLMVSLLFSLSHIIFSLLGFFCASAFSDIISNLKEHIGILFLFALGLNMITESFSKESVEEDYHFTFINILPMCFFNGINAFAFGICYSCFDKVLKFLLTFLDFGIITFIGCFLGLIFANKFAYIISKKSLFISGSVIVLVGVKLLIFYLSHI